MAELTYRKADEASLSTLVGFFAELVHARDGAVARGEQALTARMRGFLQGGYEAVVFAWAEKPVGYALYSVNPRYAHIRQIYVDGSVSKRVTLERAFTLLRQGELHNYASIRLDVPEANKEWLKRWEAIGFQPRSVRLELETARKSGYRKSCGAVVYRRRLRRTEFLVVLHESGGHWGFPKGHVVQGESEMETAVREVYEETGLHGTFRDGFYERLYYLTPRERRKEVVMFLTRVRRPRVRLQRSELREYRWLSYWETRDILSYENTKLVLDRAHQYLQDRGL